jgi:hypothetical protein
MIADIHVITRKNQRIISTNFRNTAGEQIVMIPKIIIITDNDTSNQNGRDCLLSEFAMNFKK